MMKINILGSGYMGKQIAGLFVLLGFDVFIWHNKNEKDLLKDVDSEIKKPILSPMLSQFLRRRFMELLGVLFMLIGTCLLIALISADHGDPSFGVASTNETVNLLGTTGANIASVLEQMLGHAAYGIALFPLCWGYRLIRKQKIGQKHVRLFMAPIALALLATGFFGIAGGDAGIEGGGETKKLIND